MKKLTLLPNGGPTVEVKHQRLMSLEGGKSQAQDVILTHIRSWKQILLKHPFWPGHITEKAGESLGR
jgi:hypothetical protein